MERKRCSMPKQHASSHPVQLEAWRGDVISIASLAASLAVFVDVFIMMHRALLIDRSSPQRPPRAPPAG